MKTKIGSLVFILLFFWGCDSPTSTNNVGEVRLNSLGNSFNTSDSIAVVIENTTSSNFNVVTRGGFLEMYYQKKQNKKWSNKIWFPWMSLKCPSIEDTIVPNSIYNFTIESKTINLPGTYRLLLANDTTIISNIFEIKNNLQKNISVNKSEVKYETL